MAEPQCPIPPPYDPPRIEQILSSEDLKREVRYAGSAASGPNGQ
jgi:hypothetical protein